MLYLQRWSFRTNEGIFAGCGLSHRTSRTPCTKLAALSIPASVIGVPPPPYFTECSPAEDPDRGPFFIAWASRHEVPTTPGNDDAYKVYDPDRVSHRQPNLLSTTPSGVVGISPHRAIPGSSSGLAPLLDTRAKHRAPLRGALSVRGREQKKVDSRQDVIPVGSRPYLTQMRLTGRQSSGIISSKGVSSSGAGAVAFAVSRRRLVSRSALLATMKPLRAAKPVPAGMR